MTRIVQQHPTLAARSLARLVIAVVTLLLTTTTADAALTTGACLVSKRKVWGNFRKCQVTAQVNQIKGKPADLAKCQTTFQSALTKINGKATKATIPCRYRDNQDNTVTDFDTGLMWVKLGSYDGHPSGYILDADNPYDWKTAIEVAVALNGPSNNGTTLIPVPGNGLYADWRLPTIVELRTIMDATVPGCSSGSLCIDPIFGPTVALDYWSATTNATFPSLAWSVNFYSGNVDGISAKSNFSYVRAVRTGL